MRIILIAIGQCQNNGSVQAEVLFFSLMSSVVKCVRTEQIMHSDNLCIAFNIHFGLMQLNILILFTFVLNNILNVYIINLMSIMVNAKKFYICAFLAITSTLNL